MALSSEDMRFAILDARERHKAQVDLMHANDRQALGILQLYVALAGASLSGAAVILLAGTNSLPRPVGFGLAGFSITIILGTVLALLTMWPVCAKKMRFCKSNEEKRRPGTEKGLRRTCAVMQNSPGPLPVGEPVNT